MALTLYIGQENLPSTVNFVRDVDAFFGMSTIRNDEFTRIVLKHLEQAEYSNSAMFKDRFGGELYTDCLSTGTKILLSANYYPQYTINCTELGLNAWCFVSLLKDASLFFSNWEFELHPCPYVIEQDRPLDVIVNNTRCDSYYDVNAVIGGYA